MAYLAPGSSGNYLRPPDNRFIVNPGTDAWTTINWLKTPASLSGFQNIYYFNNNHALQTNGTSLDFWTGADNNFITLSTSTWYCIGVAKNGSTEMRFFVNGVFDENKTSGVPTANAAEAFLGTWNGTDDWPSLTFGPMKIWDAFLSDAEIAQESARIRPQRTGNLNSFYPFWNGGSTERVLDYSGNGRHLTQTGTGLSDAAGPPVTYSPGLLTYPPAAASGLVLTATQVTNTIELTWT